VPKLKEAYPKLYKVNKFPDEYDDIAMNLLNGNGYRVYPDTAQTMIRLPGQVLILTILFYIFGKNLVAAQLLNVTLSFATAYIVFLLARKITKSFRCILFATLIYLFHPGTILAESRAGIEALLTFLISLFILSLYRSMESYKYKNYFISGCILGLVCLVKSTPLLFPMFLFVFLLIARDLNIDKKSVFLNIGLMVIGTSLVLSPWILRNYYISGKIIPTMTLMGTIAQEGLYATQNLGINKDKYELGFEASSERALLAAQQGLHFKKGWHLYFYSSNDEIEFDRFLLKTVIQKYIERPYMLMKNVLYNFFRFWFRGGTLTTNMLNTVLTLPFLIIVSVGVHAGFKRGLNIAPIILFIGYFLLVHLPLFALARYHLPLVPLLAVLATIPIAAKTQLNESLQSGD
jgi:4-amino-4-deoxy-L-arabinose transferase-like glycosyltransferase